ncbi:MAG: transporter [Candidatus Koribacter versatilis]|uniref:Transporter n=1 Tax=Candidatus Korobacter versatilis TaxID=658062 RepID=A0A932A836_9BACT|nr:transporter [Candidatus Koribacter versatilis]
MPLAAMPTEAARTAPEPGARPRIRFDRNEFSGAFGDIGTDFPLITGMILAAGLNPASVLTMFGAMQVLTGLLYGMPMPAQPLKAMAVLVISQKASGPVLYGAGLAIGLIMLVLASTGLLTVLANAVPKSVVRGIQFGLGLQLATLALRDYVPAEGTSGFLLAGAAFLLTLLLLGNRRFPPAPFVLALGFAFALLFRVHPKLLIEGIQFVPPAVYVPTRNDIWVGLYLLAIPQLALSFGNSILASRQVAADLFPDRPLSIRKIGLTYSLMNLINPFFGGVPTCHGSGGIAGHYTFGARTGGSVIIYGFFYLILGLFFSLAFQQVIPLFPRPVLGVMLLFEALALMLLCRDMAASVADLAVVLVVGVSALALPYGYVVGLLLGLLLHYLLLSRLRRLSRTDCAAGIQ